MRVRPDLPGGRLVGLLDVLLVLWVVLWIVLALAIAHEMRNLGRLSTTGERVGTAAVRVGDSLEKLSSVPLVGDRVAGAGSEVRAAGSRAVTGAHAADRSVDRLSVLLGLAIAVLPTAPLLVYVPLRVERAREARALRRALAAGKDRDALERFLAERAVANLSYAQLRRVSEVPWRDLEEQRYARLALAELDRLGIPPEALTREFVTGAPRARG